MITIAEQIEVASSPETVWRVLSNPREMMACIAGAQLGAEHEDGSYDAELAIRFGGLRVALAAQAAFELDEPERTGRLTARGADRQGGTRVRSRATFRVRPADAVSEIAIDGEVDLSGKLASVIEAGAAVVIARMTREFAAALTERCATLEAHVAVRPGPAQPLPAPSAAAPAVSAPDTQTPAVATSRPVTVARTGLLARLRAWWRDLGRGRAQGTRI